MSCSSATLCSLHPSSASAASSPTSAENLGRVQSLVCPQYASPARRLTTAAVGIAFHSHSQKVEPGRGAGGGLAAGEGGDAITKSWRVIVDCDMGEAPGAFLR